MVRQEVIEILSVLKVAYPNFYRSMSYNEGLATIDLWTMQFSAFDKDIVNEAVGRLMRKNTFPPSIAEIFSEIEKMRDEFKDRLIMYRELLEPAEKQKLLSLVQACEGAKQNLLGGA